MTNDLSSGLLAPPASAGAIEGHAPPRENSEKPRRRRGKSEDADGEPDAAEVNDHPDHQLDRLA